MEGKKRATKDIWRCIVLRTTTNLEHLPVIFFTAMTDPSNSQCSNNDIQNAVKEQQVMHPPWLKARLNNPMEKDPMYEEAKGVDNQNRQHLNSHSITSRVAFLIVMYLAS